MAELGYLNMFARDVQKMADFYGELFQLEEILAKAIRQSFGA